MEGMRIKYPQPRPGGRAKLATMEEIQRDILPLWMNEPPSTATLRAWFNRDRVQRLKANPHSKHGGGRVWFLVSDVERCLRNRMHLATTALSVREYPNAAT